MFSFGVQHFYIRVYNHHPYHVQLGNIVILVMELLWDNADYVLGVSMVNVRWRAGRVQIHQTGGGCSRL